MIRILIFTFILLGCMSSFAQTLPEEWSKDFVIAIAFKSSMSGSSTHVKFTYDSCVYESTSRTEGPTSKFYFMKEGDRATILKKMRELKADVIKSESGSYAVHDGWSQYICFNVNCIEGGTSAEMDEENKNRFLDAYRYLEEFAMKKAKKKK